MKRERADQLLVRKGYAETRSAAARLILAGAVRVGSDDVVRKASRMLPPDADLRVATQDGYVSRGAHKLLAALDATQPDLDGATALDVGASTGGFTEALLRRGVRRVYAVDVGYGQLHYRLRSDPRVVSLERTNARSLSPGVIPEPVDVLTADVSFISLTKVLPACARLLRPGAWAFVLVKPQFEAGPEEVGRGGVVRDEAVRQRCVAQIVRFARETLAWTHVTTLSSPILGPKGNQEFVAAFRSAAQETERGGPSPMPLPESANP